MTLEEYVKNHLEQMAAKDENFKARYEDKEKSMPECIKYIYEQAKESAKNANCVGISDEEVGNWAVHYYQEKDCKPKTEVKAVVKASAPKAKVAKPTTTIPTKPRKAAQKSEKAVELNLFGDF